MLACFFVFVVGIIFGFIGWEDYHTRGGTDEPYVWEEAVNHFANFFLLLGTVMMIMYLIAH